MDHHEAEASQQPSGHREFGMLTVFSELLIGFFEVAGAVLPDLIGGLNEVVFENAIATDGGLALMSFFVRASALFAARNDSGVGA